MKKLIYLLCGLFIAAGAYAQTPAPASPMKPASVTVAADGSGNFKTIQEAVNSFRDHMQVRVTVFIKNGTYAEKLVIPNWKPNVHLIGESREGVIITGNDHTGKPFPGGADRTGKPLFQTYTTHTVLVQAPDVIIENLTIQNTAGRVGQAVALDVEADRFVLKNCRLLGNQDTLYAAAEGTRQLYDNCYIEGTVDFIFGKATAVFRNCTIRSLTNSYITAAATPVYQKYGFVFLDCTLLADPAATKVYLGRPWRPYAKTVFLRTSMGSHIVPAGWDNWSDAANEKTVLYAEYGSTGPGSAAGQRVKWSKQLSAREAKAYTVEKVFAAGSPWRPGE